MTGRWAQKTMNAGLGSGLGCGISRRRFLQATGAAAVLAAAGTLGCLGSGATGEPSAGPSAAAEPSRRPPAASGRLAVAKDADPATAVDKAIDAYGGLGSIIRKGDKVLVKANYSFARAEAVGACNQPAVLTRILQRCKEAGAAEVYAIDNPIEGGKLALQASGIGPALAAAGFAAYDEHLPDAFVPLDQACGNVRDVRIMRRLLDADVFVNAPVVKSHGNTRMTAGMKNLMGLIYSRGPFHGGQLDQCIADLAKALRPDLVIADAYRVLATNGPNGGSPDDVINHPLEVVVGDDAVAVDAYAAGYLGLKPEDVEHVRLAGAQGLGQIDLSKLNVIKA